MRYVDTSVQIAYLIPEVSSAVAESFMLSTGDPIAVSAWSEVELLSAIGIKLRAGQISKVDADNVVETYSQQVGSHVRHIPIVDDDHRYASALLNGWRTALRAGDSLHLAIASAHGAEVFTLDKSMAKAGRLLGVSVTLLA